MIQRLCFAMLVSAASILGATFSASAQTRSQPAVDAHGNLNSLIARHAAAHSLPEELVRRVIKRESGGNPRAISKGNYGLMQIRLGTARGLGYRGDAAGLLDADTNMTYAVKYLAGAYRVAGGNHDRAVRYYAAGYYYAAKRQGFPTPGSNQPLNILALASSEAEAQAQADVKPLSQAEATKPVRPAAAIKHATIETSPAVTLAK